MKHSRLNELLCVAVDEAQCSRTQLCILLAQLNAFQAIIRGLIENLESGAPAPFSDIAEDEECDDELAEDSDGSGQ